MDSDSDFSWFDLKNYEPFKSMSINEWEKQISHRSMCHFLCSEYANSKEDKYNILEKSIENLKRGVASSPIGGVRDFEVNKINDRDYPATATVNFTDFGEVLDMSRNTDLAKIMSTNSDLYDLLIKHGVSREKEEFKKQCTLMETLSLPHDINNRKDFSTFNRAHINIDLTATDKQIINDFGHWLSGVRELKKASHRKNIFKQSYFDKLVEYGVIQYLDIRLISELENRKITQTKIAKMIFPEHIIDNDTDMVERLRKVTKPMAEAIINNKLDRALAAQVIHERIKGMKIF